MYTEFVWGDMNVFNKHSIFSETYQLFFVQKMYVTFS